MISVKITDGIWNRLRATVHTRIQKLLKGFRQLEKKPALEIRDAFLVQDPDFTNGDRLMVLMAAFLGPKWYTKTSRDNSAGLLKYLPFEERKTYEPAAKDLILWATAWKESDYVPSDLFRLLPTFDDFVGCNMYPEDLTSQQHLAMDVLMILLHRLQLGQDYLKVCAREQALHVAGALKTEPSLTKFLDHLDPREDPDQYAEEKLVLEAYRAPALMFMSIPEICLHGKCIRLLRPLAKVIDVKYFTCGPFHQPLMQEARRMCRQDYRHLSAAQKRQVRAAFGLLL